MGNLLKRKDLETTAGQETLAYQLPVQKGSEQKILGWNEMLASLALNAQTFTRKGDVAHN